MSAGQISTSHGRVGLHPPRGLLPYRAIDAIEQDKFNDSDSAHRLEKAYGHLRQDVSYYPTFMILSYI